MNDIAVALAEYNREVERVFWLAGQLVEVIRRCDRSDGLPGTFNAAAEIEKAKNRIASLAQAIAAKRVALESALRGTNA